MTDIEGSSNLSRSTKAEYPSGTISTFSIEGRFLFTVTFTVEESEVNADHSIGLIQVITQSERMLKNDNFIQSSSFTGEFPVLDGDPEEQDILWYSETTVTPLDSAGAKKLQLPDDPTTGTGEDSNTGTRFFGLPTYLKINESFTIILAKLSSGEYQKLDAWSWSYSDESRKVKKDGKEVWETGKFEHSFARASVDDVDLTGLRGNDRANNQSVTSVSKLTRPAATHS